MAKRDLVVEAIRAGGATHEILMDAADCNAAGLASQFVYLRLIGDDDKGGLCPVKDAETGIYSLITKKEWEALKDERADNAKTKKAPTKSPVDRLIAATKRVEKCEKAVKTYNDKINNAEEIDRETELRSEKADIELELAQMEFNAASDACPDGIPVIEDEDTVEEESDEAPADLA